MFLALKAAVDPGRHRKWSWAQGVVGWRRALHPGPCLETPIPEREQQRPWLPLPVSDQAREEASSESLLPAESLCVRTALHPVKALSSPLCGNLSDFSSWGFFRGSVIPRMGVH